MASLGILLALLILSLLINGAVLAWAARAVGSIRGRLSIGLLAATLILLVSLAGIALPSAGQSLPRLTSLALTLGTLILEMVIIFVIVKRAFRLPVARTFAPLAALFAISVAQWVATMLLFRPLVMEAMVLSANSMSPTLNDGDRFIANKLLTPRRWDLIAYRDSGTIFCKRLIGQPGESIRFVDGGIEIDGRTATVPAVLAGRCRATLPGMPEQDVRYQEGETIRLGAKEYFLLGDNIDRSVDSRMHGPSDASTLVGVVDLIYWPPGRLGVIR